jgi:hypothetical protein
MPIHACTESIICILAQAAPSHIFPYTHTLFYDPFAATNFVILSIVLMIVLIASFRYLKCSLPFSFLERHIEVPLIF